MAVRQSEKAGKAVPTTVARHRSFSRAEIETIESLIDERLLLSTAQDKKSFEPHMFALPDFRRVMAAILDAKRVEIRHLPDLEVYLRPAIMSGAAVDRGEADAEEHVLLDASSQTGNSSDTLDDLRTAMRIAGRAAVIDANLARNRVLIDGLVGADARDE
jgi:hypothetical protein